MYNLDMQSKYKLITLLGVTGIMVSAIALPIAKNSVFFKTLGQDALKWVHYQKREATSSQDGIREYWVSCGGGYQFSKPNSSNIEEAIFYDTSEFTNNDPRYIKYVSDDVNAFYIPSSSSFNFAEVSYLNGYSASNPSSVIGSTNRYEFYKDDNSPAYSVSVTTVTGVINSLADLTSLQTRINDGVDSGYYVFTNNLTSPNTYVSNSGDNIGKFKGTIDGRGHTINKPSFWGRRMLGDVVNGTIKNLTFTNISIFSVLAVTLTDTLVENVNFYTASTLNSYSNVGMICDIIYNNTLFKDCYVDYGEHYHLSLGVTHHNTAPIASTNMSPRGTVNFENTTVRCLPSVNMFLNDYVGRNLRPTEGITYVDSYRFINNGVMNYNIKCIANNKVALEAANAVKKGIEASTGKTITVSTITETEVVDIKTPSIVLGSNVSLTTAYGTPPAEPGAYSIRTIGKAVYINASDEYGWHPAILKFLKASFGYENIGDGITINSVADKNNVVIKPLNISGVTQFNYRRCDWGDSGHSDTYMDGYNSIGYSTNEVFINVPGNNGDKHLDSGERFHTMLRVLFPGTYVNTHKKWYATNSIGTLISKSDDSYYTWQLCFTAHGDQTEYNLMVQEAANNIITIFKNNTDTRVNNICFGIGDSSNRCNCATCKSQEYTYGSISGTLIKFVNDVETIVNSRVSETNRDRIIISTFAYLAYKNAPIKNNTATILTNDNVKIFVAPIEANYTYSIGDATNNQLSYDMFEQWSTVGGLYAWLYDTNFSHYLYPYNSFSAMPESIKYMQEKGVELAYIEGQHNLYSQGRTGFNDFKKYVNGQFLLDSTQRYEDLKYKYFKNYYGSGYVKMTSFFDEMVARLETFETNSSLKSILYSGSAKSIYSHIDDARLWDKDQLLRWVNLCSEAYNAESNAKIKKHILVESIFPRFALCTGFASSFSSDELLKMRQSFKTDATSLNITYTMENNQTPMSTYYSNWGII